MINLKPLYLIILIFYLPVKGQEELKINNVPDEDYEQIAGYPGLPRQVFLGLNYKF